MKKDCWDRKKGGHDSNENEGNNHDVNISNEYSEEFLVLSQDMQNDYYILDFDATFHATSHISYLLSMKKGILEILN